MSFSQIINLTTGFIPARIVQAAHRLHVFSVLKAGPLTAPRLAEQTKCDPRALEIVCNALVALGILEKSAAGDAAMPTFSLSESASIYLNLDSGSSLGGLLEYDAMNWQHWGKLEEAVQTGRHVNDRGMTLRERIAEHENFAAKYLHAVHAVNAARGDVEMVASLVDLSDRRLLVDIACGPASFTVALLQHNSNLKAVALDLPNTIEIAKRMVKGAGVEERLTFLPNNYRRHSFGSGQYDCALMAGVLHQESESSCFEVIGKAYEALKSGGLLIIKDHVMDESRTEPADAALFAVQLMLFTEGRSYSFQEVGQWLKAAGFKDFKFIPPRPPMTATVILATKP